MLAITFAKISTASYIGNITILAGSAGSVGEYIVVV